MSKVIPYGRQWIEDDDIAAVVSVLKSDWLTTGPKVDAFEKAVADFVGAKYAVAVSSGTSALHAAMYAIGVDEGSEVIVPPITFVATANAIAMQNGTPVFTDVDSKTLLIDPLKVKEKINARTKAVIAVDYAGQPCDYDVLRKIADQKKMHIIADSCHALGAEYASKKVGTLADLTVFSFHPVKHITCGEGGMVVTDNPVYAQRMRQFRNHGINHDYAQRAQKGTWLYEVTDLGYNYRLTDIQCALGISQLQKLPFWIQRRREIAAIYNRAFSNFPFLKPLEVNANAFHVYHLYVVLLNLARLHTDRSTVFSTLRAAGIGVNVHYIPVHLHPYYRRQFGTKAGLCPIAEKSYECMLTLPLFPAMTNDDVATVISRVKETLTGIKQ